MGRQYAQTALHTVSFAANIWSAVSCVRFCSRCIMMEGISPRKGPYLLGHPYRRFGLGLSSVKVSESINFCMTSNRRQVERISPRKGPHLLGRTYRRFGLGPDSTKSWQIPLVAISKFMVRAIRFERE